MNTRKITLFVYDTRENFDKSKVFLGEEGASFKQIHCIENAAELDKYFVNEDLLGFEEYVFLVVHVFAYEKIRGIKKYKASGIPQKYPGLGEMFISDGDSEEIQHLMVNEGMNSSKVYKYHEVYSNLHAEIIKVYTKKQILDLASGVNSVIGDFKVFPKIKYAVITALFKDEFEELKKVFEFPENKQIKTNKKIFYRGYLKSDLTKEIIAAIPNSTGMLDSSIVATMLLEFFKPDYLLMSGVCGGASNLSFGDIVLAKQIFTFQKGKLSDITRRNDKGENVKVDLFDRNKNEIDYNQLFDNDGNRISVSIEKFEPEHDSIIPLDSLFEDTLLSKIDKIKDKINSIIHETAFLDNKKIDITIEPMACSTMVINKENYFEDSIKVIHRKTAAVEMESYGVARACMFANNGNTVPIIFKSVMDNTHDKIDSKNGVNFKKFAAFTSAQFMRLLFEEQII